MLFSKKEKIDNYVDPTGELTNQQLKMSQWYVRHKLQLQKIGLSVLILWCVITLGYGVAYLGYYFSLGYSNDQQMAASQTLEFENYALLQKKYQAAPLKIEGLGIFQSADEKYDFVVRGSNINERWVAFLTYKFVYNGGESKIQSTIILPKESRPVIAFGQESAVYPENVQFKIISVAWRKVNPHAVADVEGFVKERMNFYQENFKFTSKNLLNDNLNHIVEFDLTNFSPYNFWNVDLYVELLDGEGVQGYIYTPVEKFMSNEMRHIDVRSLLNDLRVTDVKVYPVVNVFDPNEFMKPGSY